MGNLFKFLLALTLLLTGGMGKGFAISGQKSATAFSLAALAQQKAPQYHYFQKAAPVLKRGHLHAENIFHEDLLVLEEDDENASHYQKLLASLPVALPPQPFIDLHLAPGFFHKPRKLLALCNREARAYAGKPVYVLFGVFLI